MLGSVLPSYCFFADFNAAPLTGFASSTLLAFGRLFKLRVASGSFAFLDIVGLPQLATQNLAISKFGSGGMLTTVVVVHVFGVHERLLSICMRAV